MTIEHTASPKPFRVIVVGGGIVGLTLSHALQLADIDHVVLEKHREVTSLRGAALIVWPGMARVLDQLGFLDKIVNTTARISSECNRWPDGTIANKHSNTQNLSKLFETPSILFDRQTLVHHLYENLSDKSRIHTSKRVERIEQTDEGVCVYLSDGSVEEGDLVVGADGVHSKVRECMWDYASMNQAEEIPKADLSAFSAEFGGLFGVSNQNDDFGLGPAISNVIYGKGTHCLLFTQPGKVYWAIMFQDRHSQPPKKRSSSEADMESMANTFADLSITETLKFKELWKNRTRAGLLNIEEGTLQKWHAGRIVLVGDSASKMTADLGMGANLGVESAVTLCNILHREVNPNRKRHFSTSELNTLFAEYQKDRFERQSKYVVLSGQVTRMRAWTTYFGKFMISYVAPLMNDSRTKRFAESLAQAPKLNYVPVRHINENSTGWRLAAKRKEEGSSRSTWLAYVVLSSTASVVIAYAVRTGFLSGFR